MAGDQLQLRGGTATEHNSFTGATRELTADTTNKTVRYHDGVTIGGIPLARADLTNTNAYKVTGETRNLSTTGTGSFGSSLTVTAASGVAPTLALTQTGLVAWVMTQTAGSGAYQVALSGGQTAYQVGLSGGANVASHSFYTGGFARLAVEGNAVYPGFDNALTLGLSGYRWSVVYSATSAINTSDKNLKTEALLTDAVLRAAYRVPARAFRFNDAIAEKGPAARIHYGYFAQDVASALMAEGVDPKTQAFWCEDDVLAPTVKTRTVQRAATVKTTVNEEQITVENGVAVRRIVAKTVEEPAIEQLPLHDDQGNPVISEDGQPVIVSLPKMEAVTETYTEMEPSGVKRQGLRYEEFLVVRMEAERRVRAGTLIV